MLSLFPYQVDAVEALRQAKLRGLRRVLEVIATGGGKTVIFCSLIKRRAGAGRALVIAHREELLHQTVAKMKMVAPEMRVGIVQADRDEHQDVDVIVASIQTLASPRRIAPLVGTVATVIIDEAHHATARTYVEALQTLGCFDDDGPFTIGVTATAGRADGVGLGHVWQEIVYRKGILSLICEGYLCDVRAMEITNDVDFTTLKTSHGDYTDASIAQAMEDAEAVEAVAAGFAKYAPDRTAVAFMPTIATSEKLADQLRRRGIKAEHLSGLTKRDERAAILHRLHTGDTQVVTNAMVLTEGFDEPRIDCVLIGRPTASETLFTQMVGRGLRRYPGKKECLLLTLASPPEAGLATIATLAGKAPGEAAPKPRPGESLVEAAEREEAEAQQRVKVATVLQARRVALFGRSGLNWVSVDGTHVLSCGDASLIVRPTSDPERWRAINAPREGQPSILADGLTLEYALGIAEEFARGTRARLARADAAWRAKPVSTAQQRLLNQYGLGAAATSGEASDLIAAHNARRTLARIDRMGLAA